MCTYIQIFKMGRWKTGIARKWDAKTGHATFGAENQRLCRYGKIVGCERVLRKGGMRKNW